MVRKYDRIKWLKDKGKGVVLHLTNKDMLRGKIVSFDESDMEIGLQCLAGRSYVYLEQVEYCEDTSPERTTGNTDD